LIAGEEHDRREVRTAPPRRRVGTFHCVDERVSKRIAALL